MKRLIAALALMAGSIAAPVSAREAAMGSPASMPGWLAGAWAMQEGERWADEFWTPPRADIMIGAGRMGTGRQLQVWEQTRIQRKPDGSLSFFAQPRAAPPTEFPLVASSERMVEFANPAHDFPQRVRYWREGELLMAEIAKMDGSGVVRWNYRPMGR